MTTAEAKPLLKAVENPADINNGKNDLIAPTIYALYTAALIYIIYQLRDAIVAPTLGSFALSFVTGALIWDNLIISIGSFFFKDIDTNPKKYQILKWLSYPRFTFHAVGVPLQCITVAEMGKFAGVGFLQSDIVQIGIMVAAVALVRYNFFTIDPILFCFKHAQLTKHASPLGHCRSCEVRQEPWN